MLALLDTLLSTSPPPMVDTLCGQDPHVLQPKRGECWIMVSTVNFYLQGPLLFCSKNEVIWKYIAQGSESDPFLLFLFL